MNINTVSADVLRDVLGFQPTVADAVVRLRESKPQGLTSIVDLLELEDLTQEELAAMAVADGYRKQCVLDQRQGSILGVRHGG